MENSVVLVWVVVVTHEAAKHTFDNFVISLPPELIPHGWLLRWQRSNPNYVPLGKYSEQSVVEHWDRYQGTRSPRVVQLSGHFE